MNTKETALNLIKQLIEMEIGRDKEIQHLYKGKDKNISFPGESSITFHLKQLEDLVASL